MFKGCFPALVTPFTAEDRTLDEDAFVRFVDWQIEQGVNGLVPAGSTGESPTLTHEEHRRVIELCVKTANKRVPVIAGAGSNSTREAISLARHAEEVGADGLLVVTPYYNKPNETGLYKHYKAISDNTSLPIIIYNNPGRAVITMSVAIIAQLANDIPNIVGVKDATCDLSRVGRQTLAVNSDFTQLSGDDPTIISFMASGGGGWISVVANIAPKLCRQLQDACFAGDFATALAISHKLTPLYTALNLETNPTPVKYAVSRLGFYANTLRLPLVPVSDQSARLIDEAMANVGLI